MFNGFPSTNTPAIQVWDFYANFASTGATRSVSLADDCAPTQYFRTGATTTAIRVNFPLSPPDGKIIKIVNHPFRITNQPLNIYFADVSDGNYYVIGPGQTIDFCYSKFCDNLGSNGGLATGWICLNQTSYNSTGYNSVNLGGISNAAYANNSATVGGNGSSTTGSGSGVFAGASSTASGQYGVVAGGSSNSASSQSSFVGGGSSNTASSNSNTSVIGGSNNFSTGLNATCVGGSQNSASQSNAAAVGGNLTSASAINSATIGGYNNQANANNALVLGGASGITRSVQARFVMPSLEPIVSGAGQSQISFLVLGRQTTDATVTTLASNSSAASSTNQLVLSNNSAYYVTGSCIANVTGGGDTKAWTFEAVIKRGANAAATSLVTAVVPVVTAADTGAAAWTIAVSADTTNGALQVQVTGAAATTIRWVCKLESTEVTF
jgi:hypothetical protein